MNGDRRLQRAKLPAQIRRGLGVEPDGDDGGRLCGGRRRGALRRSTEAGCLAKKAIERHRGKGQADHGPDHREEEERGGTVAAARWGRRAHPEPPSLTIVKGANRNNTPRGTATSARLRMRIVRCRSCSRSVALKARLRACGRAAAS